MAGLGLVVSLGSLKLAQVESRSALIMKAGLAERDLSYTLKSVLSEDCKWNLKPGRTGGLASDGTGALSALKKTYGNNEGESPNINDDISLITTGDFKNALDIIKMEFKDPNAGNTDTDERSFFVYYKKKGLGSVSTVGNRTCTNGTGAEDQAGCYLIKCDMQYSLHKTTGNDKCSLSGCVTGAGHADKAGLICEEGKYLQGIDDQGNKICKQTAQSGEGCPSGKFLKGFKSDGTAECETPCPEGRVWKNNSCECPGNQSWNGSACACPVDKLKWTGTACEACPSDKPNWNGSDCVPACTSGTPKWDGSSCITCVAYNSNTPKWNSSTKSCEACPSGTPKWNGSSCITCVAYNSNTPQWNSSTKSCEAACPSGADLSNGHCCPIGRVYSHGVCCRNGYVRVGIYTCCPNDRPYMYSQQTGCYRECAGTIVRRSFAGYICACPDSKPHFYHSQCNVCGPLEQLSNGHCCPWGYVYSHEYERCGAFDF